MPEIDVVLFKEDDDTVPLLDWLRRLIRPEADYLRDGIYELRIGLRRVNYRILYFFHGRTVAVLSQGLVKEDQVPPVEINRAIERKEKFEVDPKAHAYRLELE